NWRVNQIDQQAEGERGQPEVGAFFDHANLTIPQPLEVSLLGEERHPELCTHTLPSGMRSRSVWAARLLRMRAGAVETGGNPLHFILTVQLHFFELDFFQQVFGI